MGFMFCDLHVSLNNPSSGGYKFVEFAFFLLLSPYLCFISLLYLDLYVLGDDALIS